MALHRARVAKDIAMLQAAAPNILTVINESETKYTTLYVTIKGPEDSLYEGGKFTLCCILPHEYPIKSPSIAFRTKVWHPNIEHKSGAICLDVLRDRWTPIISLKDVFEMYIPQLLQYPEPSDPFNGAAASMMSTDLDAYKTYVRNYVVEHATK